MLIKVRKVIASNLLALLRPFTSLSSISISKDNNIIDAYIYDWDNRVSSNNQIHNAQLDFRPKEHEGDQQ